MLNVARQAGALGAIVTGVDLSTDVDEATFDALHAALLEHLVICVRGQEHITPDDQVAFSKRWGRIEPHPYVPPIEGHPEIMRVYDPNPITVTWHADFTYAKQPPSVSLLLGRVIPEYGGDTMFSNGYLAYEGLSPGLRETLDRLRAVHYATQLAIDSGMPEDEIVNSHPVVCTHPETGRRALFVNGNYTRHFDGWSVDDSQPLLDHLYAQFARFELHLASPVGAGRPPHLGQPLRAARGGGRHRRPGALVAPHDHRRRHTTMTDIPWIVSLDDHVVEPPDVWTKRLPAKYRDVGPHIVMAPPGTPVLDGGTYREAPGTEGDPSRVVVLRGPAVLGEAPHRRRRLPGRRDRLRRRSRSTRCARGAGSRRPASTT